MQAVTMRQYLEGEQLIRISLEPMRVVLEFYRTSLEMRTPLWVKDGIGRSTCIDPSTRIGDVDVLWSLVGETGISSTWSDEIKIAFTGGAQLRIPESLDGTPRGTLRGHDDDRNIAEDF